MTTRRFWLTIITVFLCLLGWQEARAWQTAMSSLGLVQKDLEETLFTVGFTGLSAQTKLAARQMNQDQRTAAVRELSAAIKAIAVSDTFQRAYAGYIKSEYNAVDHGINVDERPAGPVLSEADLDRMMADAQVQTAVQIVTMMRTVFPAEALREGFASDREKWNETIRDRDADAEDRDKAQKMLAKAQTVAPLLTSDPEAFKKAYTLLKSAEMGGPDTEEALAALTARAEGRDRAAQEQQQKLQEQRQWNTYNFKTYFKGRLTELVATADSVDFDAQTRRVENKDVFVNPEYERKSGEWKLMYRAGKGPVTAASDFAKAWLREL